MLGRYDPPPPRDPPPVTVVGGPVGGAVRAEHPWTVAAALLLAALALALVTTPPDAALRTAPAVAGRLQLVEDRVSTSSGGVFVLPLELRAAGPQVAVDDVVVVAMPVRAEPASSGGTRVDAAGRARFVALVQPDCAMLGPDSPFTFAATAEVRLRVAGGGRSQVVVDLGAHPVVRARVAAVCGDGQRAAG